MYLHRAIEKTILTAEHQTKVVLLTGARQVGKSYILEEFGRNHYKNYVSVSLDLVTDLQNFLKENINFIFIIINI